MGQEKLPSQEQWERFFRACEPYLGLLCCCCRVKITEVSISGPTICPYCDTGECTRAHRTIECRRQDYEKRVDYESNIVLMKTKVKYLRKGG